MSSPAISSQKSPDIKTNYWKNSLNVTSDWLGRVVRNSSYQKNAFANCLSWNSRFVCHNCCRCDSFAHLVIQKTVSQNVVKIPNLGLDISLIAGTVVLGTALLGLTIIGCKNCIKKRLEAQNPYTTGDELRSDVEYVPLAVNEA